MATISASRKIERAGVNALRTLLEEHDHLVQEIDGGVDHGEDLYVGFVSNGRRTGHVVAIQVKSGKTYKRAKGYAIPVGVHRQDWKESRLPVVGVVYDRGQKRLFWVNLTQELHRGNEATRIQVPQANELTEATLPGFVSELQAFMDAQGSRVAGHGEGVRPAATVASRAPRTATRRKPLRVGRMLDVLVMVLMAVYLIFMAVMFMTTTVPALQAEGEDLGFSIGSPLAAICACLFAGCIGTLFPRSGPARIGLIAGIGDVCLNNYRFFSHQGPLDNVSAWALMVTVITCESAAFAGAPQVLYLLATGPWKAPVQRGANC